MTFLTAYHFKSTVFPTFSCYKYRFGFNGKEKDDEIQGEGNSLDFGGRIYDSRLGRWLSLDPLMDKYPSLSAYNFCANNPIIFIDPSGKTVVPAGKEERKLLTSMINNYFGSNAGFAVKKDKIHFNQKKFDKFMKTCTDPDMIENANRLKEIVTNEKDKTIVVISTKYDVKSVYNEQKNQKETMAVRLNTDITKQPLEFELNKTVDTCTYQEHPINATLSNNEPGAFAKFAYHGVLTETSVVIINPIQGISIDKDGGGKTNSDAESTTFHELIGHAYAAYKGDVTQTANHNKNDIGIKQENDYRKHMKKDLRSGTDH